MLFKLLFSWSIACAVYCEGLHRGDTVVMVNYQVQQNLLSSDVR